MAANASLSLCFALPSSSSSSSASSLSPLLKHKPLFVPCSARPFSSLSLVAGRSSKARVSSTFAATVVDEEEADGGQHVERENNDEEEQRKTGKATEVYVCNLPRSCDTEQLLHMFKPHGTILSAEVCRDAETGESRGSAYVTMESISSARKAVAALDGSDVGGREMRVKFSVEMNPRRRNLDMMNSSPHRVIYYEGPHKLYVGNVARTATPENLRHLFGRFGTVASVRVLQDLKPGKSRVYAFVSYLSEMERDAAMSLHGTEFCGRPLVVREGTERTET